MEPVFQEAQGYYSGDGRGLRRGVPGSGRGNRQPVERNHGTLRGTYRWRYAFSALFKDGATIKSVTYSKFLDSPLTTAIKSWPIYCPSGGADACEFDS
jgi:hypothetical protein